MKTKVIRASQSPLNKLQWLCELDCGHQQWVTSKRKPRVFECSNQHVFEGGQGYPSPAGLEREGPAFNPYKGRPK